MRLAEAILSSEIARPVLQVRGLCVQLENGNDIVSDISFSVNSGEVLALVGESGSGKTTIAMALLAHTRSGARIVEGEVSIDDTDILKLTGEALREARGKQVTYVAQNPAMALNPLLRIGTHLQHVLDAHEPGLDNALRQSRILAILNDVGLPADPAFLQRFPHQLSGGQQQRIMLALAFVLRPQLIILDEPTTALDVTTQARILTTIKALCQSYGVAAVYVSHDLAVVKHLAHRVMVLYAGRIAEFASKAAFFSQPLHPYSQGLLAAIPDVALRAAPKPILGQAPAPQASRQGCAFAARCSQVSQHCWTETPGLIGQLNKQQHLVACLNLSADIGQVVTTADIDEPKVLASSIAKRPLLQVRGIFAAYSQRKVLFDVSLSIAQGECLALVGESGSGKTTLARLLAGLGNDVTGEVRFNGDLLPLRARDREASIRRQIQYIFQNPYQALNPRHTVGEILRTAVHHFFDLNEQQTQQWIVNALAQVSLHERFANSYPRELSGGELQRVSIARALICEPRLLICDEITSALDVSVQATILELLRNLQKKGLAILFVTHNLGVVRAIADRVVVMRNGLIVETGAVDELLDHPQERYTQTLIEDSPSLFDAAVSSI